MRPNAVDVLACPSTGHPLTIGSVLAEEGGEIREGTLVDPACHQVWPIHHFIPRFVRDGSYTTSFGEQWNRYRRTQIDRFNGTTLSSDRFYAGTQWNADELKGQRILEVGCGAGRFTQVMLDAGAEVYATDYSTAVDACWNNHGPHRNLCVAQADLYVNPFRRESFDRVLCFGVLQHTPDVKRAFMSLLPFLKSGGRLAIDVYARYTELRRISRCVAKYWWRPITKRLPTSLLTRIIEWYVPRWFPVDNVLQRIPKFGRFLVAIIPCWNYTGILPLTPEQIKEWAILDTFDALSARYDLPQTVAEIHAWFEEAGLQDINVRHGGNGILANGRMP